MALDAASLSANPTMPAVAVPTGDPERSRRVAVLPSPVGRGALSLPQGGVGVAVDGVDLSFEEQTAILRRSPLVSGFIPRDLRAAEAQRLATATGLSVGRVYGRLKEIECGKTGRKPRADRGVSRVLPQPVQDDLQALMLKPQCRAMSAVQLLDILRLDHPDLNVSPATIGNCRKRCLEALAAPTRAPRKVVIKQANQYWQIDSSIGDFWIVGRDGKPERPLLTSVIDAATRCIMYAAYTDTGRSAEISGLLFHAIRRVSDEWPMGGLPETLVLDHGKVFKGRQLGDQLAELGVIKLLAPPYFPQFKGKVERCFRTIHQGCELLLPGACGPDNKSQSDLHAYPAETFKQLPGGRWQDKRDGRELYTMEQANDILQQWIITYHARAHSELGMTPAQAWQSLAGHVRTYHVDTLAQAFLNRVVRRVRGGVVTVSNLEYYHPDLGKSFEGTDVEIRYTETDLRSIFIYDQQHQLHYMAGLNADLVPEEPLTYADHDRRQTERRAALQDTQELKRRLAARDILGLDPADLIRAGAAQAETLIMPEMQLLDDPTPGLTAAEVDSLQGIEIEGLQLMPERRQAAAWS